LTAVDWPQRANPFVAPHAVLVGLHDAVGCSRRDVHGATKGVNCDAAGLSLGVPPAFRTGGTKPEENADWVRVVVVGGFQRVRRRVLEPWSDNTDIPIPGCPALRRQDIV